MLKRHADELSNRLDQVTIMGTAEIRKDELLLWFGLERLGKTVWRDISGQWADLVEDIDECSLLVAERNGTFVFIWGQGLTPGDGSWFVDIRSKFGMGAAVPEIE